MTDVSTTSEVVIFRVIYHNAIMFIKLLTTAAFVEKIHLLDINGGQRLTVAYGHLGRSENSP